MAESVTVRWGWQRVGELALAEGKLRFPRVPNRAGIYRFRLTSAAGPLPRRFQHYRAPGPSQRTNLRLNPILVSTLTAGGAVGVEVTTEALAVAADGTATSLDLSWKAARVLVERAAEVAARMAGEPVLNL
jgi:hypothetical protein